MATEAAAGAGDERGFAREIEGGGEVHEQDNLHEFGAVFGGEFFDPGGAVGERGDSADHRLDADDAPRDEVEAERVFAGRAAGAVEGELAGDHGLQWEINLGRVADDTTEPPQDGGDGEIERGEDADDLEGDIGAAAGGEFATSAGMSTRSERRVSVAPRSRARARRLSARSTAMMRVAPAQRRD